MAINATDLRKGMAVRLKGDLCLVEDTQHRTPGNWRAFIQATLRSMNTGKSFEHRFSSSDKVENVNVSHEKWEFSYKDQTGYNFMNPDTYDTVAFDEALLKEVKPYLVENLVCEVTFVEGKALNVEAPPTVIMRVEHSPEGVKGDSTSNVMKPAELETGHSVQVPLFIKEGEEIKIDTRNGKYMGRAKE